MCWNTGPGFHTLSLAICTGGEQLSGCVEWCQTGISFYTSSHADCWVDIVDTSINSWGGNSNMNGGVYERIIDNCVNENKIV